VIALGRPDLQHVQHHLRHEAEEEAEFVAALAGELGLECHRRDLDGEALAAARNLEAAARKARYQALAEMAAQVEASWVAVGHHADDQLETVLMRLTRGASVGGLAGMAWRRRLGAQGDPGSAGRWLVRPLLGLSRAELRQYLTDQDPEWREDATNQQRDRERASLRAEVLPVLRRWRPTAAQRAVRLGEHLREVQAVLQEQIDAARESVQAEGAGWWLPREACRQMPRAVLFGLLRELLTELGVSRDRLSRRALQPAVAAARDTSGGHRVIGLAAAVVVIERDAVRIEPSSDDSVAAEEGS